MGRQTNDESWKAFYREYEAYYKKFGNTNIPAKYVTENGIKLGRWFAKQKTLYSKGSMPADRIELLEKYPISWSYFEDMWNKHYNQLKAYYDEHGNSNISNNYVSEDGFYLGEWLNNQRIAYKNRVLSKRRLKLLRELNFKLNPVEDKWDEYYYALEDYYKENGHANPPSGYVTEKGIKLGNWICQQRQAYKGTGTNKISNDRIMLLNDLNFEWSKKDTIILRRSISNENVDAYKKVMLERMKHILKDLSYEMNDEMTNISDVKTMEKEIVKRMWK